MDNSDEDEGDPCDSGEDLDTVSDNQIGQRAIKTSDTINTQATGNSSSFGGNQNFIMSLDFNEPAIAIGSYCRVDQPPRQGS
jgi:hypothetical protein